MSHHSKTGLSPEAYFLDVRRVFEANGSPELALRQRAYLKNKFDFFGLYAAQWMALCKQRFEANGLPEGDELTAVVRRAFGDDRREMHYFGIELFEKQLKKQPSEAIEFLEELILENSWWDSVDWLAKLVGQHFDRFPSLIAPTVERWMASETLWLQRVCLIFQLHYKKRTDFEMMTACIERLASSREFFIQKAIGWALRQHSKTDAAAVRAFVERCRLAPLSRREALRLIGG